MGITTVIYDEKAKARMMKYMRISAAEPTVRDKRLMEGLCRRLRYECDRADHEAD